MSQLMATAEQVIESYPPALKRQIQSVGGLTRREAGVWLFHHFLRTETDLERGSVVDYRKYVAELMDENGKLVVPSDLSSHKQAAVSKARMFENLYFKRTTTEVDSGE